MTSSKTEASHRKSLWFRRATAASVGCAFLAAWAGSAQAADYQITLDRGFLERAVEDAVTTTMITADPKLYWGHVSGRRVEISRKSASTISIDLDLAYRLPSIIPDPEVDVDIDVGFSCFYAHPDVNLSIPYANVSTNFPWYIDVATLGFSWVASTVANAVISNKIASMEKVKQNIIGKINEQLGMVVFDFCPAFNVTSGADVQVIFGLGNECTPGATRHKACGAHYEGPGWDDDCINGYWERTGGYCEPSAPPGGQRP